MKNTVQRYGFYVLLQSFLPLMLEKCVFLDLYQSALLFLCYICMESTG